MMKKIFVVHFLCLFAALIVQSCGTPLRPDQMVAIDEYINDILVCGDFPGITLSVVANGQTQLTRGYGKASLETGEDMDENNLLVVGSVTKAVTATLLVKLISDTEK